MDRGWVVGGTGERAGRRTDGWPGKGRVRGWKSSGFGWRNGLAPVPRPATALLADRCTAESLARAAIRVADGCGGALTLPPPALSVPLAAAPTGVAYAPREGGRARAGTRRRSTGAWRSTPGSRTASSASAPSTPPAPSSTEPPARPPAPPFRVKPGTRGAAVAPPPQHHHHHDSPSSGCDLRNALPAAGPERLARDSEGACAADWHCRGPLFDAVRLFLPSRAPVALLE